MNGLSFFGETIDPLTNAPRSASRVEFLHAAIQLCPDTTFFTRERILGTTTTALPTRLPDETMIYVARQAHVISQLPTTIFAGCTTRFPEMESGGLERPAFRADQSTNPITLYRNTAATLDELLQLVNQKEALVNYSRPTPAPAGGNGPVTAAQRIRAQEAGTTRARACLDERLRGISAMVDPVGYIDAAYRAHPC